VPPPPPTNNKLEKQQLCAKVFDRESIEIYFTSQQKSVKYFNAIHINSKMYLLRKFIVTSVATFLNLKKEKNFKVLTKLVSQLTRSH